MNKRIVVSVTLVLAVFLLSCAVCLADASKLNIKQVDVFVDDKLDENINDGHTVVYPAKPESKVEIDVRVENLYTISEGIDIRDVKVKATIQEIDDGDDIDEESDTFDLRAGASQVETLFFDVPLAVEKKTYTVLVEVEGEDTDRTLQTDLFQFYISVEKKNDEVKITQLDLYPTIASCGSFSSLGVEITNIGMTDEDNVHLEVKSLDLGINYAGDEIEIDSDPFSESSVFSKSFSIPIPPNTQQKEYIIDVSAYYDNILDDERKIPLQVECTNGQQQEAVQTTLPEVQVINGGVPSGLAEVTPQQNELTGAAVENVAENELQASQPSEQIPQETLATTTTALTFAQNTVQSKPPAVSYKATALPDSRNDMIALIILIVIIISCILAIFALKMKK